MPSRKALEDSLELLLLFGAARKDASPEQLHRLREELLPVLENYRQGGVNIEYVTAKVRQIMGTGWEPSPDWKLRRS